MSKAGRRWVVPVVAVLGMGTTLYAATPQEIDTAIDRAKDFLYSKRNKAGNWEVAPEPKSPLVHPNEFDGGDWGGLTAIAVHAQLAAGERYNDERLKPAIELLLKSPMHGCIYALCQRDQVLELLPRTEEVKKIAKFDGLYLEQYRTAGEAVGLYFYPGGKPDQYDHSVSQFGVLGMWACAQLGFEVPEKYWQIEERVWQRHQDASGGWSYKVHVGGDEGLVTPSMTAAGVATLFITQDYVHSREGLEPGGNISNPAIDKGMQWLGQNFDKVFSGIRGDIQTYTLYGIERIGVAGGYKYFGKHDWYAEGSDWLVKHQEKDGSFGGGLFGHNHDNVPSTAFAMFFLTRGRQPLAFNKVQYDFLEGGKRLPGPWNERPRDIAKITHWIEKQTERDLNWHVVSLKDTPADDLQDAPILYISGNHKLDLGAEDLAKLRQFVEDGGLILGNPDGASRLFLDSFKSLGAKLFPTYEMRPLPDDHAIFTREQFRGSDARHRLPVLGLSNGARELMILPSVDYGKAWQGDLVSNTEAFNLTDNIYLYASGRALTRNGVTSIVHPDGSHADKTAKVARLEYAGNFNPEPGGWRRLAAVLHNHNHIDLQLQTVKLGENKLAGFKVACMTGTTKFTLNAAQRDELKKFVEGGGLLVLDAAGAAGGFQQGVEIELPAIFGDDANNAAEIPAGDALYQGGEALPWGYRSYAIKTEGSHYKGGNPHIRGIKVKGRWGVLWSREDISNALVGHDIDGVVGYTPDAATALMCHLIKKFGI